MPLLGGALASGPISAHAQQTAGTHTGGALLGLANDAEARARIEAFEQRLERQGWSEGQDLRIESRFDGGGARHMQALSTEPAGLNHGWVLAHSTPLVRARVRG